MPHNLITIILTLLTFSSVYGQTNAVVCDCPRTQFSGTKADTIFHISNGKAIVLCGYKTPESEPTTFSEFVLAVCGQDTIIDFWGAVKTCRLKVVRNALLVEELKNLPTGKNFKFQNTVWTTEKIYFRGNQLMRDLHVNRQIRKYDQEEISLVLKSYETAKPELSDHTMELANKLFIASISGDQKARIYFNEFEKKFGKLDGAFAEEYGELSDMLGLWERKR